MYYKGIETEDMLNGDGIGSVLWVCGCSLNCKGCQNPEAHDPLDGQLFDARAKEMLLESITPKWISRVTLSGGDPLHDNNVEEIWILVREIREKHPDVTIWLYTGQIKKDIENGSNETKKLIIQEVDVLVDGPFIEALSEAALHEVIEWRGSKNQNIYRKGKERF